LRFTLTKSDRRFPPPWSVEEQDACYVVRDRGGQRLAYVYFKDEPGPAFFLFQMQLMKARLRYQIGRSANWLASSSRPRQWSRRSPIPPYPPDEAGAIRGVAQRLGEGL
jgi:hypothetical protein